MSIVTIDDSCFTNIANAIRGKNGETTTYKPNEMAAAISALSGGGDVTWQYGKIKTSDRANTINLSSIVADYSKIDCIWVIPAEYSTHQVRIYSPYIKNTISGVDGYLPVLIIGNGSYDWISSGTFNSFDTASQLTYYIKESEFAANGNLYLYYYYEQGIPTESKLNQTPWDTGAVSIFIFYH